MTALYLSRIQLADFRSFAKLDIALAPEPGVLIVHGTNGLGKSSLFDALEWTLTDAIDHFRIADGYKKVGTYLSRWREKPGPTSAALEFSDGSRIAREIASVKATSSSLTGSVDDVTAFLRAPDWLQPITALGRYLLLTHFLGQSIVSRLTHRPPSERFEILKEASQTAELEAFGIALHGKGSNLAARAFTKRIEELDSEARSLREVLSLEAQLWDGAQVAGAIDDETAARFGQGIASSIARGLAAISSGVATPPLSVTASDPQDLQTKIDALDAEVRGRDLALTQASQLLEQHQRDAAEQGQAAAAIVVCQAEIDEAAAATAHAVADAARLTAEFTIALGALSAAKTDHAQRTDLRQAHASHAELGAAQRQAEHDLDAARDALAEADHAFAALERRHQIAERLAQDLIALDDTLENRRTAIDTVDSWLERAARIAGLQTSLAALEAKHEDIDQTIAEARLDVDTARTAATNEASRVATMQASVSEMSAAVATIAAHLPAESCECPVCATLFPEPQSLAARVGAAAERLVPLLADLHDAARAAQAALDAATARLETLLTAQSQLRFQRSEIAAERSEADLLLARLGWSDRPSPADAISRRAELERGTATLRARQARRRRWIGVLAPDLATLAAARSESARRRDDARRAESLAQRASDDGAARLAAAAQLLETRLDAIYPGASRPSEAGLEAEIAAARESMSAAQAEHDRLRGEVSRAQAVAGALQASEAEARVRFSQWRTRETEAQTALGAVGERWVSLGWNARGASQSELDTAAERVAEARSAVDDAGEQLRRLREGREAWIRQEAHRDALERLVAEVDLAPNATRSAVREAADARLAAAEQQSRETREVKDIAAVASADIAEDVEEFSADYLKPLGALSNQINQAILCDPRVGVGLHVNKKKIEQSASLAGELPPSLGKVDPRLVHSEGQMAALAVSMLCAASLTYPWSRWRALVLDDPLQHNDAIHAAAFADLVGNLVQHKGYQVLLSTHDLAQAEFLRRKFEARHIPCAGLDLLGRGKEGVEWTFRPANAAPPPSVASA